jgi:hypothetical protein
MSIRTKLIRMLEKAKYKTSAIGYGDDKQYFSDKGPRSFENIKRFQSIYQQGGLVTQALNCYPEYMLMNVVDDWTLTGNNDLYVEHIHEIIRKFNFYDVLWQQIINSIVSGDGIAEVVLTRSGNFHSLIPRNPLYFSAGYNENGHIAEYRQKKGTSIMDEYTTIAPEFILHNRLITQADDPWGIALVGIAYDEIMRDTATAEGTANGIERHGTPKWDIVINTENQEVSDEDIERTGNIFKKINSMHEFVHRDDLTISEMDTQGVPHVKDYSETSLDRLSAAVGVPSEIMGLGRGSTEATAKVRAVGFAKKIKPMQKRLNYQINEQFFMPELMRTFGAAEPVYIDFGEIVPQDFEMLSTAVQKLMPQIDPFLLLHRDEFRALLNYPEYDTVEEVIE